MPFVLIDWIVSDSLWWAKAHSSVRATREHYIAPVAGAELLHRGQHIDIVICGGPRVVYCQEDLPCQPPWVDRRAKKRAAAEVD
jgi:hypothetical protein